MLKISDSYIVSFDLSHNEEEAVLTVTKFEGSRLNFVNVIEGVEAKIIYNTLVKNERGNSNE